MLHIAKLTISSLRLAVLSALVITTAAHTQTITTFDAPSSTSTVPVAINSAGQIAGYYDYSHAFLRGADGTFTSFAISATPPNEYLTYVTDMSDSGAIVGYSLVGMATIGYLRLPDGTFASCEPFCSTAPTAVGPIPDSGVDGWIPFAINAVGQITGTFGNLPYKGYIRQPDGSGAFFQLGNFIMYSYDINIFGQITGTYADQTGWHGFIREPNARITSFDVPGSADTRPRVIDQKGQVAGYYVDSSQVKHGFIRKPNGQIQTFDPIGSVNTQVMATNLKGQITGYYATADGMYHGFVRDKNGEIETLDVPGASGGTYPRDINDLGEIVGYYQDANSVPHGFIRGNDKDPKSHFTN